MQRWCLLICALAACTNAQILQDPNVSPAHAVSRIQFYLVGSRTVNLKLSNCTPGSLSTCDLNDQEASYLVQRTNQMSGHYHTLLNARTVRTEFGFQANTGVLNSSSGRQEVLELSANILAKTTSALLVRPLSLQEIHLVAFTIAPNVPRCVRLHESTIADMWVVFVYREAQQANFTASDPIHQFAVMLVLFLAQDTKPAHRPDPLKFALFVHARLAHLVGNTCTEAPKKSMIQPHLVSLPKQQKVIQLVTVHRNGTVTVKEVEEPEVRREVPFAPVREGAFLIAP